MLESERARAAEELVAAHAEHAAARAATEARLVRIVGSVTTELAAERDAAKRAKVRRCKLEVTRRIAACSRIPLLLLLLLLRRQHRPLPRSEPREFRLPPLQDAAAAAHSEKVAYLTEAAAKEAEALRAEGAVALKAAEDAHAATLVQREAAAAAAAEGAAKRLDEAREEAASAAAAAAERLREEVERGGAAKRHTPLHPPPPPPHPSPPSSPPPHAPPPSSPTATHSSTLLLLRRSLDCR